MLILLSSANRGKCVNLCGVLWQILQLFSVSNVNCRFQWPRGLRRRSAATHLLRLWVRIPPGAWMCICCECCVLSGRGLCDKLITRPEESYRLRCVVVCDLETTRMRRPWPALGRSATAEKKSELHDIWSFPTMKIASTGLWHADWRMDSDFWRPVLLKRPWLCTSRHRVTFQKVLVFSNTSVKNSNLAFPKYIFQLTSGLIPCSRQVKCCSGCWRCNGKVSLLTTLVCTQPMVANHAME